MVLVWSICDIKFQSYVSFSSDTICSFCKRQCSFILPILCYQVCTKHPPLSSNSSNTFK